MSFKVKVIAPETAASSNHDYRPREVFETEYHTVPRKHDHVCLRPYIPNDLADDNLGYSTGIVIAVLIYEHRGEGSLAAEIVVERDWERNP